MSTSEVSKPRQPYLSVEKYIEQKATAHDYQSRSNLTMIAKPYEIAMLQKQETISYDVCWHHSGCRGHLNTRFDSELNCPALDFVQP